MKLTNPTDIDLNRAFAIRVLGWRSHLVDENGVARGTQLQGENINWAGSSDAVMPHLQNHYVEAKYWAGYAGEKPCWAIGIEGAPATAKGGTGSTKTFAKSAVIALLEAHGVEVEFTY